MQKAVDRAGKAGKTSAGTPDRNGQSTKKKAYGMSEAEKKKIQDNNAAMAAAKKAYEEELAKQNREAIKRMRNGNRKAAKALQAIRPNPFIKN